MVEGARLESVYSGNAIAGSNPALSAKQNRCLKGHFFIQNHFHEHTEKNFQRNQIDSAYSHLFCYRVYTHDGNEKAES